MFSFVRKYFFISILFIGSESASQQLKLGANPHVIEKSAVLELSSTKQGLLLPRLTDTSQINLLNPPDGMVIYFTANKQFMVRANGYWNPLATSSSLNNYWSTNGNSNGASKQLGNIDNFDLSFLTNNTERLRILASGNIGIGTTTPTAALHLKAGSATAGTAPLKLTSGTLLTTGEVGAVEFLTDKFYGTITTGNSRKEFTLNDAALTSGRLPFATTNGRLTNASNLYYSSNRFGVSQGTPTAFLHIGAGLSTANNAPLKFTSGANLTTPEAGAMEFDGSHLYITIGATRYQIDQQAGTTYTGSNGITLSGTDFRNNLSTGIAGGQTVTGGTNATDNLTLSSTTNATKGKILFGNSGYNELNNRLGIGTASPNSTLHVFGANPLTLTGVQVGTNTAADSILTITNGLVRALPASTFQSQVNGTGFVKATGTTLLYDNNTYTIANAPITGATKTKITFDGKGLVTAGADATTSDIAEGSNLYYTDTRVRSAALTGLSTATATSVVATDNILTGVGKLQGQINSINSAGYLTGNQTITLSGDISGSGATSIVTTIGTNKVTLGQMAQVATGTFLGRTTTGIGNVEALTTSNVKTMLGLTGNNTGDVTVAGQNYLTIAGQTITANAVDLSGTHVTGTLAAGRFGALTGDVTNTAGSYATTIATGAVTYAKMQNVSLNNRLLGRASVGAGVVEELTIGTGLTLSGTTLNVGSIPNSSLSNSTMGLTTGTTGTDINVTGSPASLGGSLTLNIPSASATARGVLTSTDWTTFNNKVSTTRTISTTAPLTGGGDLSANRTLSMTQAGTSSNGWLSSADWNTFNNKQATGNYLTALTGDVTATGPGSAAATIATGAVTYAKMQNVSLNNRLLGRASVGAGVVEELTIGTGLTLSGTTLNVGSIPNSALSNSTINLALSSTGTDATVTGSPVALGGTATLNLPTASSTARGLLSNTDWTSFNAKLDVARAINTTSPLVGGGDLSADRTLSLAANGITNNLIRQSVALSVIGRSANSVGDVADIAAGTDGHVLRRSGTTLGFGTVATAGLTDRAVTYAKIQNISTNNRLLGRATTGAGVVEEITIGNGLTLSGGNLFADGTGLWSTSGNSGITASNFLGTTDNNALRFRTNNTERVVVDANGNVGIGTSAPTARLHLVSNTPSAPGNNASIWIDNLGTEAELRLDPGGTGANYTFSADDGSNGLRIYENTTERVRLLPGGNMGIGVGNPADRLTVAGIVAPSADNSFTLGRAGFRWSAVHAANGTIQTSDKRLKTNIHPLAYGLKEVLAMRPVGYNWKTEPSTNNKIGLIAQEVRAIVPEVVVGDEAKENLGMNYSELVPVLINAMKEQQTMINDLKKELQSLRTELQELKSNNEKPIKK